MRLLSLEENNRPFSTLIDTVGKITLVKESALRHLDIQYDKDHRYQYKNVNGNVMKTTRVAKVSVYGHDLTFACSPAAGSRSLARL